jgi:hypothetical protein
MPATKKRTAAGKPKAKVKRRSASKVKTTKRLSRATKQVKKQVKETAMKALAGAAAGAVRAIVPSLEKAVGGQREAQGRKR